MIEELKNEIKRVTLKAKEHKKNQERLDQESKKVFSVTIVSQNNKSYLTNLKFIAFREKKIRIFSCKEKLKHVIKKQPHLIL